MPSLSRQQFVDRVLAVVRERFPLVKIAKAQTQNFSLQINGHVAPLENLYRISKLHPDEMRRHIERWMVELLRAEEGAPDRLGSFDELRERLLPMVLSNETTEVAVASMITQPWIEGLVIGYAIDHDRTIAYVSKQQFADWKIDLDEMREIAMTNLANRSEGIEAHAAQDDDGSVNLVLFQTMDGYDASRILLPSLYTRLRDHLGAPFAAGIPNRDILICFRDDPDLIRRVKYQVAADFRSMPHQVTDRLLLVTPDGVAPY
jgi:hypothetical protein